MYLPLLAILVIVFVLLLREKDPARRSVILRRAGFAAMALGTLFIGAFLVAETFHDPGGWEAVGLVALWVIPLGALGSLAWFRPDWAVWVFAVLIAGAIGVGVWFAADPDWWRAFEDRNGPVRDIGLFALSAAIALLGLKRTRAAGILLLVLGIVPAAVATIAGSEGNVVLYVISSAPVVAGAMYVWSAADAGRAGGLDLTGARAVP
ncbi:MAG TPA: hypothetical protein VFK59_11695 [Actinomycetota bacterium]|nr:hypothetical protein [Actinomycetota bacterium]